MPLEIRPSQALRLWRQVHLDLVRDGESDLSARQTAILLTIYLELPPHTVRGLAAQLGVTKPVITRALDTMGKLGLVTRRRVTSPSFPIVSRALVMTGLVTPSWAASPRTVCGGSSR
nr:MarR family transcriptional regulator [Bradyrhizobium sp. CCH1-B1]